VNNLPDTCSGMCISPCNDACQVVCIQAEQDTDKKIKVGEITKPISFLK